VKATKRVPVSEKTWEELSYLKKPGETFSQLLEEMIAQRKKAILFLRMKEIEEKGEFVEMEFK
jgi:predicted CopG family antitoxin